MPRARDSSERSPFANCDYPICLGVPPDICSIASFVKWVGTYLSCSRHLHRQPPQAAIRALTNPRRQSGQYFLRTLAQRISESGRTFHKVSTGFQHTWESQATRQQTRSDGARPAPEPALQSSPPNPKILLSAVRSEIRTRAREAWAEGWREGTTLAAKASKFLLDTSELLQFRHLNEAQSSEDDDVDPESAALMKDG